MSFFKTVTMGIGRAGTGLFRVKSLLPRGIAVIFIFMAFWEAVRGGFTQELWLQFAQKIIAAEITIRQYTIMAINNDPTYNLFAVFGIIGSLLMLWYFAKMIIFISGFAIPPSATSPQIKFIVVLGLMVIIEFGVSFALYGFAFTPIKDGVWFLFTNYGDVWNNIHWTNFETPSGKVLIDEALSRLADLTNITNITMNDSNIMTMDITSNITNSSQ